MKTFQEIVADTWVETGLSGSGPADVTSCSGKEKRVVGWVRQAYADIQQYRDDWPWMRKVFSFTTSANKPDYSLVYLDLTDVETWLLKGATIYRTTDGAEGEASIKPITYEYWWENLRKGLQTAGAPELIFTDPVDNTLRVHPTPNAEYTITLRYQKQIQLLQGNSDIPEMPTNNAWREIIKWRALYLYAFYDGNPALLDEADEQYETMIHTLDNRYGSSIAINGSPIA